MLRKTPTTTTRPPAHHTTHRHINNPSATHNRCANKSAPRDAKKTIVKVFDAALCCVLLSTGFVLCKLIVLSSKCVMLSSSTVFAKHAENTVVNTVK